jgi:hypothetical protein
MAGTIVVDRIESDSSYTSTINVASKVNFAGGMQIGGQDTTFGGMRNRIINGAMTIDQRNAGSINTKTAGSGDTFHLDRWLAANGGDSVYTIQQVSDAPTGFINSLKITTTTADASIASGQVNLIRQSIEGLYISDLAWGTASAKTITLSFWVKSSLTGQFGGSLTNSATNRSRTYTYTINAANTWEYKTITIPGDTSGTWLTTNGQGIRCDWNLGTGSTYLAAPGSWNASNLVGVSGDTAVISTLNATWQITGVQLEKGSSATDFEYRGHQQELALCQRYALIISAKSAVANGFSRYLMSGSSSTGALWMPTFPVQMRVPPSLLTNNFTDATVDFYNYITTGTPPFSSVAISEGDVFHAQVGMSFSSGSGLGNMISWRWKGNPDAYIGFSADV